MVDELDRDVCCGLPHVPHIKATRGMREHLKSHPGICYGVFGKIRSPEEFEERRREAFKPIKYKK